MVLSKEQYDILSALENISDVIDTQAKDLIDLQYDFSNIIECDNFNAFNDLDMSTLPRLDNPCNIPIKSYSNCRGRRRRTHEPVTFDDVKDINVSVRALTDNPSNLYDTRNDHIVTIGQYSKGIRRTKIARYKAKRARSQSRRHGSYRNLYECRKRFAQSRPRIGGRFVQLK